MKCEVVQEKLSCYLDGVIDEATMEMIEDHLNGCSQCRAELAALQTLTASVGATFEVEPPAGLKSAIYNAIEREPVASPECETILALLSDIIDSELGEKERAMAMQHLDGCEACAREHVMMQRTVSAMASLCEIDPPLKLKSRIAAAIAEEAKGAFGLDELVRKARRALQPAQLRWAAGVLAAAALALTVVISPMRQGNVAVVSQTPDTRVDAKSTPSDHAEAIVAEPVKSSVEVASVEPARKVASRTTRVTGANAAPAKDEPESERVALAPATRQNGEKVSSSISEPTVSKHPTHAVAAPRASDTRVPETTKVSESAEPAAEGRDDAAQATVVASEVKPTEVKIAAQEPILAPQDDQAMIRSLKQQMRMKQKSEGISVDLVDLRF